MKWQDSKHQEDNTRENKDGGQVGEVAFIRRLVLVQGHGCTAREEGQEDQGTHVTVLQ